MNKEHALRLLETIQRAGLDWEIPARKIDEKLIKALQVKYRKRPEVLEALKVYGGYEPPNTTSHEDPISFHIYNSLLGKMVASFGAHGIALPEIVFGTAPAASVGATSFSAVGEGSALIVINRKTVTFCELASRIAVTLQQLIDRAGNIPLTSFPERLLDKIYLSTANIISGFRKYHEDGGSISHAEFTRSPGQTTIRIKRKYETSKHYLIGAMELFLLGHELTHIHLAYRKKPRSEISGRMEELMCDHIGNMVAQNTVKAMMTDGEKSNVRHQFSYLGGFVFLSFLGFIEYADAMVHRKGEPLSPSKFDAHPSYQERLLELLNSLNTHAKNSNNQDAINALRFCHAWVNLLSEARGYAAPLLLASRDNVRFITTPNHAKTIARR